MDLKHIPEMNTKSLRNFPSVLKTLFFLSLLLVLAQRRQKLNIRVNEMTISSLNRDYVIHIPGLLGKVLNYACKLPCEFSFSFRLHLFLSLENN